MGAIGEKEQVETEFPGYRAAVRDAGTAVKRGIADNQ